MSYYKNRLKIIQNYTINTNTRIEDSKCYIATYVYGFESQEVYFLRKFRDELLLEKFNLDFIVKLYYYLSPKIIDIFGENKIFRYFCKMFIDFLIFVLKK